MVGGGHFIVSKSVNFEGFKVTVRNSIHDISAMQGAINTFKNSMEYPVDVVVDIGAHCGGLSLFSTKYGAKRVFAFEAAPINYCHLVNNIYLNGLENIIIPYNLAVSNETGDIVTMHIGDEQWNSNSSKYMTDSNYLFTTYTISFEEILNNLDHIDFLKIDVEGMEFEFLLQTPTIRSLLKKVKFLDLETHPDLYLGKIGDHNNPEVIDLRESIILFLESCGFDVGDYGDTSGFNNIYKNL